MSELTNELYKDTTFKYFLREIVVRNAINDTCHVTRPITLGINEPNDTEKDFLACVSSAAYMIEENDLKTASLYLLAAEHLTKIALKEEKYLELLKKLRGTLEKADKDRKAEIERQKEEIERKKEQEETNRKQLLEEARITRIKRELEAERIKSEKEAARVQREEEEATRKEQEEVKSLKEEDLNKAIEQNKLDPEEHGRTVMKKGEEYYKDFERRKMIQPLKDEFDRLVEAARNLADQSARRFTREVKSIENRTDQYKYPHENLNEETVRKKIENGSFHKQYNYTYKLPQSNEGTFYPTVNAMLSSKILGTLNPTENQSNWTAQDYTNRIDKAKKIGKIKPTGSQKTYSDYLKEQKENSFVKILRQFFESFNLSFFSKPTIDPVYKHIKISRPPKNGKQ